MAIGLGYEFIGLGVFFILFCGIVFYFFSQLKTKHHAGLHKSHHREERVIVKNSVKEQKTGLFIICCVFFTIGLGVSCFGILTLINAKQSTSWPTTTGQIVSSRVDTTRSRLSGKAPETSFSAVISYKYTANGITYHSNRISFGFVSQPYFRSKSSSRANRIIKKYPKDKEVKVFYDPENPEIAVLEAGTLSTSYVYLVIGFSLMLTTLAIYKITNIAWRKLNKSDCDHVKSH